MPVIQNRFDRAMLGDKEYLKVYKGENLIIDNTNGDLLLEYTIRNHKFLISEAIDLYLPKLYKDATTEYIPKNNVFLVLKDGSITDNLDILDVDVDYIRIFYPKDTYAIKFKGAGGGTSTAAHALTKIISIDTSNIRDMSWMFFNSNCGLIDFSQFNTSNVVTMKGMFANYRMYPGSYSIDLSGWDTSNVTDMSDMFSSGALTSINLSGWDTSNVTDMSYMFSNCLKLKDLDLSHFNTSKVTNMYYMFEQTSLENLRLDNWDVRNVKNFRSMFMDSSNIRGLDLSTWITKGIEGSLAYMFDDCSSLEYLNISTWDTRNITSMDWMFFNCSSLKSLDLSRWDTSNVTSMYVMFSYCSSLASLNLSNFDTSKITKLKSMFEKVPSNIDWGYDGTNYSKFTLTEKETTFNGIFPWNKVD